MSNRNGINPNVLNLLSSLDAPVGTSYRDQWRQRQEELAAEQEALANPVLQQDDSFFQRSTGELAGDIGSGLAKGVNSVGGAIVQTGDASVELNNKFNPLMSVMKHYFPERVAESEKLYTNVAEGAGNFFKSGEDYWQDKKSKKIQDDAEYVSGGESFFDAAGRAIERPQVIPDLVADSAAYMLPGGWAARALAATGATKTAVTTGSMGVGALLDAGATGMQAKREALQILGEKTPEQLMVESPDYKALRDGGISHKDAVLAMGRDAGFTAQAIQLPISFLASKFTGAGKIESDFFTGQGVKNFFSAIARETAEEGIQESSAQVATNIGVQQNADESRSLTQDVGKNAALGMIAGGAQASGMKALGAFVPGSRGTVPDANDDGIDAPMDGQLQTNVDTTTHIPSVDEIGIVDDLPPVSPLISTGDSANPDDRFKFELNTESLRSRIQNVRARRREEMNRVNRTVDFAPVEIPAAQPAEVAPQNIDAIEFTPPALPEANQLTLAPLEQSAYDNGVDFTPAPDSRTNDLAAGVEQAISRNIDSARNARMPENFKDTRLLRNRYRTHLSNVADSLEPNAAAFSSPDSLLDMAAKNGGLNAAAWAKEGIDPADAKLVNNASYAKAFRQNGGMTPDDLAEFAAQRGFSGFADAQGNLDAGAALSAVNDELAGNKRYSLNDESALQAAQNAPAYVSELKGMGSPKEIKTAITKALEGKKLGARQLEIVQAALDNSNTHTRDSVAILEKWAERSKTMLANRGNKHLNEWRNRDEHADNATTHEAALNEIMVDAIKNYGIDADNVKAAYDKYSAKYTDMNSLVAAMTSWVSASKPNTNEHLSYEQQNRKAELPRESSRQRGAIEGGAGLSPSSQTTESGRAGGQIESGPSSQLGNDSARGNTGLRQSVDSGADENQLPSLAEGFEKSLLRARPLAKKLGIPNYNQMKLAELVPAIKKARQAESDAAYVARNKSRIEKINSAKSDGEIDAIVSDEYSDSSRWSEATSSVENAARSRKRDLIADASRKKQAENDEKDLSLGKEIKFEMFENTTDGYKKANKRIDELNKSGDGYHYGMKEFVEAGGEKRDYITKRKIAGESKQEAKTDISGDAAPATRPKEVHLYTSNKDYSSSKKYFKRLKAVNGWGLYQDPYTNDYILLTETYKTDKFSSIEDAVAFAEKHQTVSKLSYMDAYNKRLMPSQPETQKPRPSDGVSVSEDVEAPEGYHFINGKGAISHKWALSKNGESAAVWNYHESKSDAVAELRKKLERDAESKKLNEEQKAAEQKLVQRLASGGEVSESDLRMLDLKSESKFEYLSPVVQRLFGVSKSKVREAMGDALFEKTNDFGTKYTWGNARRALKNASGYVVESDAPLTTKGTKLADKATENKENDGGKDGYNVSEPSEGSEYVRTSSDLQGGKYPTSAVSEPANDAGRGEQQFDLFSPPNSDKRQEFADLFGTIVKPRPIATISASTDKVNSIEDLAHLMASIRKDPQENFYAVAADKNGKVLRVMHYTRGTANQSSAHPIDVVAEAASIDGIHTLHLAHNHPSGTARASSADEAVTRRIFAMLDGTGINAGHHAIIARYKYADGSDVNGESGRVFPRARKVSIPVTERRFTKNDALDKRIVSPDSAREVVGRQSNALFLLNNDNAPVAIVTLSEDEMQNLRKGEGVKRVLSAIGKSNAVAAIIKTSNKDAAQNLARMLNSFEGMNVLDWLDGNGNSDAEKGGSVKNSEGVFYSLDKSNQEKKSIPIAESQAVIDKLKADWKGHADVRLIQTLDDLPSDVRQRLDADGKTMDKVQGIFHPKTGIIYLNANKITSKQHAKELVFHEAYTHLGLTNLFGKDVTAIMGRLYLAMGGQKGINALAKKYDIDLSKYEKLYEGERASYRNAVIAEELLAHISESPKPKLVQPAKELIGAIRAWLRKNGFAELASVNDADIAYLLKQSRETITKGKASDTTGLIYTLAGMNKAERKATNEALKYSLDDLPEKSRKMIEGKGLLEMWGLLAQSDEAFKYPTSDSKDIETVFREVAKRGFSLERQAFADKLGRKQWAIMRTIKNEETGENEATDTGMLVVEKGDEVWLNVALGNKDEGGSALYAALGNYAYNAGKVFIGDPNGLSPEAVSRRLENMISLALKFGTTKHIRPHAKQVKGAAGVDAVRWIEGADSFNLRSMIAASYKNVLKQIPEIEGLRYDVDKQSFVDENGNELTSKDIENYTSYIRSSKGVARDASGVVRREGIPFTVGGSTVRRAVLTNSFLRGSSEEQSELLASMRGELRESSPLREILYSLDSTNETRSQGGFSASEVARNIPFVRDRILRNEQSRSLPPTMQESYERLGDKTLVEKLKSQIKRQLTPAGLLPQPVFDLKIARDGEMNAVDMSTRHTLRGFYDAVEKAYGMEYQFLKAGTKREINKVLRGDQNVQLAPSVVQALTVMRDDIKRLSALHLRQLVADAAALRAEGKDAEADSKQRLIETISDNFDTYLNRSYRAFDDKNWPSKVPAKVYQDAVEFLAGEYAKDDEVKIYKANRAIERKAATTKEKKAAFERRYYENYEEIALARKSFELSKKNFSRAPKDKELRAEVKAKNKALLAMKRNGAALAETKFRDALRSAPKNSHIEKAKIRVAAILTEGTAFESMGAFISEGKLGSKDLSIMKKRKDVPAPIRALLGEYEDAAVNYAKSVTKMSRLVHNHAFLTSMKQTAFDLGLISETQGEGMTKIAADASEAYAPLNGLYTTRDFKQALVDVMGKHNPNVVYDSIVAVNGMVKMGKTVLAPTTAMRNFMSSLFFTFANGHFDYSHAAQSVRVMQVYFKDRGPQGVKDYMLKMRKLGVIYDSPYASEMMDLLKDSQLADWVERKESWLAKNSGKALDFSQRFYSMGDDFYKIIGFENEKALLIKHRGLSEAEAEKEAAERIRNTYPTYSMIGKGVNTLRRFPLVGSFVSFPAEIIRTSYHITRYLKDDFQQYGIKDPIVMRKVAGYALAAGLISVLSFASAMLAGVDDDEEDAVRAMAPEWSKNATFLWLGKDEKGNRQYIDLSFLDPYGYWKRPITAALNNDSLVDAAVSGAKDLLSPFLGWDIAAKAIGEAAFNGKVDGGPVYNESDSAKGVALDISNHLRKALQPGFVTNIEKFILAGMGEKSKTGKEYKTSEEFYALIGWRVATFDPKVALYYQAFEYQDKKSNAAKLLSRVATSINDVSEKDIREAYSQSMAAREDAFVEMSKIVGAARSGGLTNLQLLGALRNSGVSVADARALISGKPPVFAPTKTMMKGAIKKSAVLFDTETQAEFKRREKYLNDLRSKSGAAHLLDSD